MLNHFEECVVECEVYVYDTYTASAVIYLLSWDEHWECAEATILYIILQMTYIDCLHGCQLLLFIS